MRERAPGAGGSSDRHDGGVGADPGRRSLTGTLSRKASAGPAAQGAVDQTLAAADTSAGQPVPGHLQERFAATGADVSNVELHTSSSSAQAAEAVSARAYTVGQDVHFGAGEYAPGTPDGDFLIAHEVAHTIQQADAPSAPQFGLEVSQPHDPAEVEADQAATAIVSGSTAAMPALSARGPQRKLMRWANDATALQVVHAIEAASGADLHAVVVALGDAEGSADAMVPIDIPGYSGYVAREDIHPLFELAQRREGASAPTGDPGDLTLHGGFGSVTAVSDAHIRLTEYAGPARELSRRVMADVAAGRLTHMEGREIASGGRTALRLSTRERISPSARRLSEAIEPEGATLGQLVEIYAVRLLRENPALRERFGITEVARGEAATEAAIAAMRNSPEVSAAVIEAAGRTNPWMTGASHLVRVAAPVMMGVSVAAGTYRVLSADEGEHLWTAGEEISGMAGSTVATAVAGVVMNLAGVAVIGVAGAAAAPVVLVTSFIVVAAAGIAGGVAGESVWDNVVDHDAVRDAEREIARALEAFASASTGDRIAAGMPVTGLAAGGGLSGLMERDRRRVEEERRRGAPPPETSGGEAP